MFGKNKKTSFAGFGMLLTAIADIFQGFSSGNPSSINWQIDIASIIGGIGFMFAKDGNVTGGTVMQPSSTKALLDKADEQSTPKVAMVLSGNAEPTETPIAPIAPKVGQ